MRIAIVGGGAAGITAAYLIQRNHQVSLYEKNAYVGGKISMAKKVRTGYHVFFLSVLCCIIPVNLRAA